MYYKLSNLADRERIERAFKATFEHPNLYKPEIVLNGLAETNLPIILSNDTGRVKLSIWGLLPERYKEDWEHFQNLTNTLNINETHINSELWYADALEKRRCLILVTGFFTTFIKDGITYPYYVGKDSGDPFCLAGVYNILEDGFITCSLVVTKADSYIQKFQNICDTMPLTVPKHKSDFWLDENIPFTEARKLIAKSKTNKLKANPIAKEFFNQNILYDSMLETYEYDNLPIGE